MNVVTIIQARLGSSRLPGKVLMTVGGRSILEWVVHRVRLAGIPGVVLVATSDHPRDDPIEAVCGSVGVPCFRGSEADVLDRYYRAARTRDAEIVVRVTADCPLLDPALLAELVEVHRSEGADYVTVAVSVRGIAQETLSMNALERSWESARLPAEREHVILYLLEHPDEFKVVMLPPPAELDRPGWRLTIDTAEDLELLEGLFETAASPLFDLGAPEIVAIVAGSERLRALATREP